MKTSYPKRPFLAVIAACAAGVALSAAAADWSDTYLGYRYGTKFREPFVNSGPSNSDPNDITKNIVSFTHTSGYRYGINFFNVDFLMSDDHDPANCANFQCSGSAQEAYAVYRNILDFAKITGGDYRWGFIRGWGATIGFDWNTKNDAGYASKKRMLLLGPTVFLDVPGYWNVSVFADWESNAPCTTFPPFAVGFPSNCIPRYRYKTHAELNTSWAYPFGATGLSFEGYFRYFAKKGTNEFGGETKPETHFDGQVMYDLGAMMGAKGMFKVGLEYEYWKNKFGTDPALAGPGATAKTPMIRAEYHF